MAADQIIRPDVSWHDIDTVLLDLDGTLLDKHFDDYFWEQYVPENYSLLRGLSIEQARAELRERYRQVENTLDWTDLDYWSGELGLDIPGLKSRVNQLIAIHPFVMDFLQYCRQRQKEICLVTNAHSKTLAIKLRKIAIGPLFDRIVCAGDVGCAKEDFRFWPRLAEMLGYNRERTLLADDTEKVLRSAAHYGIRYLIFVAHPSSRQPVRYSGKFASIEYFNELIPDDEEPTADGSGRRKR